MAQPYGAGSSLTPSTGGGLSQGSGQSTNLGDILERVLDKGLVIAGDIQVNLLDIELLTIKLRLVVASLETAREAGINWWETDPWLHANNRDEIEDVREENERLRKELAAARSGETSAAIEGGSEPGDEERPRARRERRG